MRPWPGARVVLEVGAQSPGVSRRLRAPGYATGVANARRVRLIAESDTKSDRLDAEVLARLGRVDPALLAPIQHRRERTQRDLGVVKARAALVRMRTLGVNHVRGVAKALGHRLPACAAEALPVRVRAHAAGPTLPGIEPLLAVLEQVTASIRALDRALATLATTRYPVTELLRQVPGVGPLTALTYVLTLEAPTRFPRSRTVGAYLGLCRKRRDSGAQQPELSITKAGDALLRRYLVTAAHYILGRSGPTRTSAGGGWRWPAAVGKPLRNGPSWRWRGSWPCCCIGCGSRARCTNRWAIGRGQRRRPAPTAADHGRRSGETVSG